MRKLSSAIVGLIGGAALFGAPSAQAAVTLLSLTNPPGQTGTPYEFELTAPTGTTTISIGGYANLFEYVSNISFKGGDGSEPSQTSWTLARAANGSNAGAVLEGTSVRSVYFGGLDKEFDIFTLSYSTIPGADYFLKFDFTNNALARLPNLSALEVTTSAAVGGGQGGVPEASTWLMMLVGFGGLGLAGYIRLLAPRLFPQR